MATRISVDGRKVRSLVQWRRLRWVLAILLLAAAGYKSHQVVTQPLVNTGVLSSFWALAAFVNVELFLAAWLASDLWPLHARVATLLTFAVFALVSLTAFLRGAESCGCFGRASPNPVYTLVLDIALVALIAVSRPEYESRSNAGSWVRAIVASSAWVSVTIPLTIALARLAPDGLANDDRIVVNTGVIVFDPEKWVGKRFQLFQHLSINADLARGQWLVFFHQHSCSACHERMPHYLEWARWLYQRRSSVQIAFVEVPPLSRPGVLQVQSEAAFSSGTLNERLNWFVHTPAILRLDNGTVSLVEDAETFLVDAHWPPEDSVKSAVSSGDDMNTN